ncbi:hypothetical protein GX888_00930 [Candidatus Dojkabacteria bacterium]|uniref:tRNA dimethylallyltransferase n=1 Tax=Candidatus Dojkabacteria bacterium TaxID=2099670 RepID=A0A847VCW1_9BACT|nr:hypothetical protein [Candidatus Dojkabacteria bacterium]
MINYKGKMVIIAGPTASGKSDVGLELAKKIDGYIVNADSRQVYRHLDIGTAKPQFEKEIEKNVYTIDGINHYLFNIVDPTFNYTLYHYQRDVGQVLNREKGIPILVGGTGLYIDSVVFNYILTKKNREKDLSKKTVKELQHLAKPYLDRMNKSDRENRHRLIRAIARGGVDKLKGREVDNIYFVINLPKSVLESRVRERIEQMFRDGLLQENKKLLEMSYTYSDKGMNSIGYIEFKEYFEKIISLEEVKENIYRNTMKYIKRQNTWFRRNSNSIWIEDLNDITYLASNFILKE